MLSLKSLICLRNYSQQNNNIKLAVQGINRKIKRMDYNDNLFSQLMLSVKSKKTRLKQGLIALEGRRLIQDALKVGIKPVAIFFTKRDQLDKLTELDDEIQLYKMPYKDMDTWSDLTTCPGIVAFCKKPEPLQQNDYCLPVIVVCDQVREPGNLGALLRCASGAGVEKVLLTKGCVDPWDCKVLRGGSGAHFRLPIVNDLTWDNLTDHISNYKNILLAVNQPSLIKSPLKCCSYYEVNYRSSKGTVIVVGGETQGLSDNAFQIAEEMNGKAINIPLSNNIDSLNCVSAISIILFEIKRQLFS